MVSALALPPELAAAFRALDPLSPEASRRATAALATILDRWRFACDRPHPSRLTGDGFPVELVFSSAGSAIRYTSEVTGTGIATRERLRYACDLMDLLGQRPRFPLARLQEGDAHLLWGVWLGGRHTASSDCYKLFVEVPGKLTSAARSEFCEALGRYRVLLGSAVYAPRIVGFEPLSGKLEFYFRGRALEPRELCGLMRFSGLADQEEALFSLLEEASRHPARERLPGNQHGFSISTKPGGEVDTFTFFLFARSLFGADPETRSALLALAKRRGWNLTQYAAVTALLQRPRLEGPRHGIVSFFAKRSNLLGISVGFRP